jgi:hypothetical protein
MKKILLTAIAALGLAASASAQLAEGSVFPDFTLTDINGNSHNLYSLLNSGKTVFIDISATWCPPCWAYHNSGALDGLWADHGPTGGTGVSATTTNDVEVFLVQGEATSHLAELYGQCPPATLYTTTELPYSTVTQGNWVSGTLYPIIDDTTSADPVVGTGALDAAWDITYFPTVYMICRDHLVHVMSQPTEAVAYAAALSTCPTYAPSTTVDAKATPYTGQGYYICNATPTVSFQNYSTSSTPLTAATINVMDATGTTVATQAWTGSLASYAIANVPITSFAGTSFSGYKFSVTAAGDTYPANNVSADSIFKVYNTPNATAPPYAESFATAYTTGAGFYKYSWPDADGLVSPVYDLNNPAHLGYAINITGPSGSDDTTLEFDGYDAANEYSLSNYAIDFIFGNYSVTSSTWLTFDEAYAATTGATTTDELQVNVSSDCGAHWTAAWTGSGTTLETAPVITSGYWFVPGAASQWKHVIVSLSADANPDLMIELTSVTAPSGKGQGVYVDNLLLTNVVPASVNQLPTVNSDIMIYPNPAKDVATVSLTLTENSNVNIQVIDAVGRTITTVSQDLNSGSQKIELSTANLPSGLYNVKIAAGNTTVTKQLSVVN